MERRSKKILLFMFLLYQTNCVFADAPFLSDSPSVVDYQHWQTYFFSANIRSNLGTTLAFPAAEIDYGLMPNVEFDTIFSYLSVSPKDHIRPSASGMGDTFLELKYRFLQESDSYPALAFAPIYAVPNGNADRGLGNGRSWEQIPIVLEKNWNTWRFYADVGYALNSEPKQRNFFYGGCVLEKNITDKLSMGAEFYTQGADSILTQEFKIINLGGEYSITKILNIVLGIGHTIQGQEATYTYAGIHLFL